MQFSIEHDSRPTSFSHKTEDRREFERQLPALISMLLIACLAVLNGCARMAVKSVMAPTVANLQRETDLDLVCEGAPSYLLMLDSMLASDPGDRELLMTATQAFSAYAEVLDVCGRPERAATVSIKAKQYGQALLAARIGEPVARMASARLHDIMATLDKNDAALLFWSGNGWATWIRYQEGSPASLADLFRVEQIMQRVVELDETVYHGGAHIFLGAYYGAKPAQLGGKPGESRAHFEKALAIGHREFLPTLVAYAQVYARMMYDRELYVRLLNEVEAFPLDKRPDLALVNQAAKRRAKQMLKQVDRFF